MLHFEQELTTHEGSNRDLEVQKKKTPTPSVTTTSPRLQSYTHTALRSLSFFRTWKNITNVELLTNPSKRCQQRVQGWVTSQWCPLLQRLACGYKALGCPFKQTMNMRPVGGHVNPRQPRLPNAMPQWNREAHHNVYWCRGGGEEWRRRARATFTGTHFRQQGRGCGPPSSGVYNTHGIFLCCSSLQERFSTRWPQASHETRGFSAHLKPGTPTHLPFKVTSFKRSQGAP